VAETGRKEIVGRAGRFVVSTGLGLLLAATGTVAVRRALDNGTATAVQGAAAPKRRYACYYDPQAEPKRGHVVYVGQQEKPNPGDKKPRELGKPCVVDIKTFFDSAKPLAMECHEDGTVLYVTADSIYEAKISNDEKECATFKVMQRIPYTNIPEFTGRFKGAHENAKVIAADLFWPVEKSTAVVAIVTDSGLFMVFNSPKASTQDISEKFLWDVANQGNFYIKQHVWPGRVTGAVVGILNRKEFAIIPIGGSTVNTKYVYVLKYSKDVYGDGEIEPFVEALGERRPGFETIIDATTIVYDEVRGGLVTLITGQKNDGSLVSIDLIVKPSKEMLRESR
jgi:hypothetical protein